MGKDNLGQRQFVMHYGGKWGHHSVGVANASDYKGGKTGTMAFDGNELCTFDVTKEACNLLGVEWSPTCDVKVSCILDGLLCHISDECLMHIWNEMKPGKDNRYHIYAGPTPTYVSNQCRKSARVSTFKTQYTNTSETPIIVDLSPKKSKFASNTPNTPLTAPSKANITPRRSPRLNPQVELQDEDIIAIQSLSNKKLDFSKIGQHDGGNCCTQLTAEEVLKDWGPFLINNDDLFVDDGVDGLENLAADVNISDAIVDYVDADDNVEDRFNGSDDEEDRMGFNLGEGFGPQIDLAAGYFSSHSSQEDSDFEFDPQNINEDEYLAGFDSDEIEDNDFRETTPKGLKDEIFRLSGVNVSYYTAYKAREKLQAKINGTFEQGFSLVPELQRQVLKANPGSVCRWFMDEETHEFSGFFLAYEASLKGRVASESMKMGELNPYAIHVLEKTGKKYRKFKVQGVAENKFCVVHIASGKKYTVELDLVKCSCVVWQMTGLPCVHAICVLRKRRENMVKYCSPYYSTDMFKATYAGHIMPIENEEDWDKVGEEEYVLPPPKVAAPGRQRKLRIRDEDEENEHVAKQVRRCRKCGRSDHNARRCDKIHQVEARGASKVTKANKKRAREASTSQHRHVRQNSNVNNA
ncbi:hypothetical protein FRX31_024498, partial [Thalictrum thalictroides]